jgi:hypothetical protein
MTILTASRRAALIPRGQEAALASMTATCIIRRTDEAAPAVRNPVTGQFEKPAATIYAGVCELKFPSATTREADPQSQALTEQEPLLKLPLATSSNVLVDDIGEILTSRFNPGQVGVRFRIAGEHDPNHATARRLPVEITN